MTSPSLNGISWILVRFAFSDLPLFQSIDRTCRSVDILQYRPYLFSKHFFIAIRYLLTSAKSSEAIEKVLTITTSPIFAATMLDINSKLSSSANCRSSKQRQINL